MTEAHMEKRNSQVKYTYVGIDEFEAGSVGSEFEGRLCEYVLDEVVENNFVPNFESILAFRLDVAEHGDGDVPQFV